MLEIKKIYKEYKTDSFNQVALDGICLCFRDNGFASVLGPSGSGKTTLLNIIGGLDKYTSGDLIINGVSTKDYTDRDWDTYRNHKIGFVFQSYNLISHISVLANVELALSLAGISKEERRKMAYDALCRVGLEKHVNKRPNQLSGGQMQRVAIARAIVNNPDIILADEPTGALDTKTSVQIMEILKELSKEKLVIMVTHNPELASEYSTRIIELKDGKITSDSNPYKNKIKDLKKWKVSKTSMSFKTALGLSFNNLMVKKKRTALVSFAGSIGIIGIALILSLSTGFQNYIDKLQEDTLSSYPLSITSDSPDLTSMILSMAQNSGEDALDGKLKEKQYISTMFSNVKSNDLKSFKRYIEDNKSLIDKDISSIMYGYSVSPIIYTKDVTGSIVKVNPSDVMGNMSGGMMGSFSSIFSQLNDDMSAIGEDYDVLAGKLPSNYNELIIVLSDRSNISDLLVYFLGLRDYSEFMGILKDIMAGESVEISNSDALEFTYDDLLNIKLKLVNPSDLYKYNSKYKIYEDMSDDDAYLKKVYKNSEDLKIVGIIAPKEGVTTPSVNPGVGYLSALTKYVIDKASREDIVKKQLENENVDIFSNKGFDEEDKNNNLDFQDMISIDKDMLSKAFGINLSENEINKVTMPYMNEIASYISSDTSGSKKDFDNYFDKIFDGFAAYYDNNPYDVKAGSKLISNEDFMSKLSLFMESDNAKDLLKSLEEEYFVPSSALKDAYVGLIKALLQVYINSNLLGTSDEDNQVAVYDVDLVKASKSVFMGSAVYSMTSDAMAKVMLDAQTKSKVLTKVGVMTGDVVKKVASSFNVDSEKIAGAFKFNLSEEELTRLMSSFNSEDASLESNLTKLGYQDLDNPSMISIYFNTFDAKDNILKFIDDYNEKMEENNEEDKVIHYTDATGILMSSVKKITGSVTYVLIAFVSISLIVSSIMIGIITYISVLERTKEIGILRAIGASKRNISSIFNAETFIIGLFSGLIGIGITLLLLIPINIVIHNLTGNNDITAMLPIVGGATLIILSVILTLIGGLIPSKMASKKDPVEALRSE